MSILSDFKAKIHVKNDGYYKAIKLTLKTWSLFSVVDFAGMEL
jgi:hypothetical protein